MQFGVIRIGISPGRDLKIDIVAFLFTAAGRVRHHRSLPDPVSVITGIRCQQGIIIGIVVGFFINVFDRINSVGPAWRIGIYLPTDRIVDIYIRCQLVISGVMAFTVPQAEVGGTTIYAYINCWHLFRFKVKKRVGVSRQIRVKFGLCTGVNQLTRAVPKRVAKLNQAGPATGRLFSVAGEK